MCYSVEFEFSSCANGRGDDVDVESTDRSVAVQYINFNVQVLYTSSGHECLHQLCLNVM